MIDSHCHLDDEAFATDRAAVLSRANACGVEAMVVPAVGADSWDAILELADETSQANESRCYAALGLHPVSLLTTPADADETNLQRLAAQARTARPVAIGECGLDMNIDLELAPLDRQEAVLRAQLALARELDLPVILHARGSGAYRRLTAVLGETDLGEAGGVLHSYSGGADLLRELDTHRLYFGFAGPATYPDARRVRASIQAVAADRLLAETDAPDQTPAPHRPGRCEPAYLGTIVAAMAQARGQTATQLATLTTNNARRLFRLADNTVTGSTVIV
jgi:TatD DNase family protein